MQLVLGVSDERICGSFNKLQLTTSQLPTSYINATTTSTVVAAAAAADATTTTTTTTTTLNNISLAIHTDDYTTDHEVSECIPIYTPTTDNHPEVRTTFYVLLSRSRLVRIFQTSLVFSINC